MLTKTLVGVGIIGSGLGAGAFLYRSRLKGNSSITADEFHKRQHDKIVSALKSADELRNTDMTLYRYTTCPFCCKLQTFLDYHKLHYQIVEVNPLSKSEIKDNGYSKVPQLQVGKSGPILVDSDEIVEMLNPLLAKHQTPDKESEDKWRQWAREKLVRYMVLNTNRTLSESRLGYKYASNIYTFSGIEKAALSLFGGPIMYLVAHQVTKKKLLGLGFDGKDERKALYQEVDSWVDGGLKEQKFHGGDNPDLADFDVYGIIQSQRFLPVFNDLMDNTDKRFSSWIHNMDKELPESYSAVGKQ